MKKESMLLVGLVVVGLIGFTACPSPTKVLFYQQNGNYVVDHNYILQAATKMSAADIQELVSIDKDYLDKTKGKLILTSSGAIRTFLQINQTGQVNEGGQIAQIGQIGQISQIGKIKTILDFGQIINIQQIWQGCFEVQNIDWNQYGDLKVRLDAVLTKYKPAYIDGNIAIQGDRLITAAVKLQETDISTISAQTIKGVDEYSICPDGVNTLKNLNNILTLYRSMPFDFNERVKFDKVLVKYNQQIR